MAHVSSRPHVALLGRIPGTRRLSDRDRLEDNELIPNVMIFRPESIICRCGNRVRALHVHHRRRREDRSVRDRLRREGLESKLGGVDLSHVHVEQTPPKAIPRR